MIDRLVFENFRGFESLKLEGLKRVNLIVGKNNSGKTSVLEGLVLACDVDRIPNMPGLFRTQFGNVKQRYFQWLIRDCAVPMSGAIEIAAGQNSRKRTFSSVAQTRQQMWQSQLFQSTGLDWDSQDSGVEILRRCAVVPPQSRNPDELVKIFGHAVRQRSGEEQLESVLQAVDPRIRKVRVDPADDGNQIVVDIGLTELVPLSQAGQGIARLVAIFSELIGEKVQLGLIDEIENGLHHSVLETVWRGIAEVAARMDVQVFATTHSYECIQAAHEAFAARDSYDFSIVQLFRVDSAIRGRVLNREQIESALAGNIDLRGL